MTYSARPGTVAFKAITYLQSLDEGAKVTSGNIAAAIGEEGSTVMPCLLPALEAGVVVKSTPPGQQRPAFWSLAPKGVVVKPAPVPPPGPQTPLENPARGIDIDAVHRARKPAPPPVRFMCDHGNPINGLNACGLCHAAETSATKVEPALPVGDDFPEPHTTKAAEPLDWASVSSICGHGTDLAKGACVQCFWDGEPAPVVRNTPPEKASTEAAQVDGKDSSEDHAEERSRADGVDWDSVSDLERWTSMSDPEIDAVFRERGWLQGQMTWKQLADIELGAALAGEWRNNPKHRIAPTPPSRIALTDDDTLEIDGHVIQPARFKALVRFLDRISLNHLRESAA